MERKQIVLVETDEEYIAPLLYRLLDDWEERADIVLITQLKYFNDYFSRPRDIEVLVINELLYSPRVQMQHCSHVFLLTEEENRDYFHADGESKEKRIYKYATIREIYAEIMKDVRIRGEQEPVERTALYTVFSLCGGCGKTLAALGLSSALHDMGKRILYLSMESVQDFPYFLEEKDYAGASFAYALSSMDPQLAQTALRETGREGFDYVKALEKTTISYRITDACYQELIRQLIALKKYDGIVVELPRELTRERLTLLQQSERVLYVGMQTEGCAYKMERLLHALSIREEQWVFVCNRYRSEEENYLANQESLGMYRITEYIGERQDPLTLERVRAEGILDSVAYVLE